MREIIESIQENKLAEDHWEWIEGIFKQQKASVVNIEVAKYLYISAFIHGWKHAMNEVTCKTNHTEHLEVRKDFIATQREDSL